jgi:hypothetical protein
VARFDRVRACVIGSKEQIRFSIGPSKPKWVDCDCRKVRDVLLKKVEYRWEWFKAVNDRLGVIGELGVNSEDADIRSDVENHRRRSEHTAGNASIFALLEQLPNSPSFPLRNEKGEARSPRPNVDGRDGRRKRGQRVLA